MVKLSLETIADYANGLAKYADPLNPWYEGLMTFLCELELELNRNDEVLIEREEEHNRCKSAEIQWVLGNINQVKKRLK